MDDVLAASASWASTRKAAEGALRVIVLEDTPFDWDAVKARAEASKHQEEDLLVMDVLSST